MPTAKFGGALDFTRCQGSQKYEVFVCLCVSVCRAFTSKVFAQKLQKFVFFSATFLIIGDLKLFTDDIQHFVLSLELQMMR